LVVVFKTCKRILPIRTEIYFLILLDGKIKLEKKARQLESEHRFDDTGVKKDLRFAE
jgi:hypothetical protein